MKHLPADSNFLKIEEEEYCSYKNSRYVVYAAPYEHTSSYREGSKKGPGAVIEASQFVELYDEELDQETYRTCGVATVPALNFGKKTDEAALSLIENRTAEILSDKKFPVMIGAEHTVTLATVRAYKKKYPDLTVLQIDAHSDLRDQYEDSKFSHASVMARVHDLGVPLVQVGIRAQCIEESELIKANRKNIHTIYAHQLKSKPTAQWIADAVKRCDKNVYITIDADGFDPSIIPAVGTPEPNGLTWMEGVSLLREVCKSRNVVGFDVVEMAPLPNSYITEIALAKLIYKLMGYVDTNR